MNPANNNHHFGFGRDDVDEIKPTTKVLAVNSWPVRQLEFGTLLNVQQTGSWQVRCRPVRRACARVELTFRIRWTW